MQSIGVDIVRAVRRKKMMNLEFELKGFISSCAVGEMIVCPMCRYIGKNKRGTAKVYPNNTFKCFGCGVWRRFDDV